VKEMAKEVQTSRSGEAKQTAEDLDEFMNKVFFFFSVLLQARERHLLYVLLLHGKLMSVVILPSKQVRTGSRVSNEEILGFAKLFNDELTLDNISRSSSLLSQHYF
jgi:LETM1 and EF-hand domain-containing protein 1